MLLLVACCYFWCCLCTTGNRSERERVRAAFASTPAVNKRPPAAAQSLLPLSIPLFSCLYSSGCHISCSHAAYMTRHCDGPKFPTVTRCVPLAAAHVNGLSLFTLSSLSSPSLPLFRLSYKFFWLLVFSFYSIFSCFCFFFVLLSDPEHSKKAKKAKNVDLLLLLLLLFLYRLLLKA